MGVNNLLSFILKVCVYTRGNRQTLGTAFIVGDEYAITAKHVLEGCEGNKVILETHDSKYKIENCFEYCSLKIKEKYIDIAIIKFDKKCELFTQYLELCISPIELKSDYSTYGYPELNDGEKQYISGQAISPENELSIEGSTGEYKDISLYSGVSGAPLVINGMIYGIIFNEILTTQVTLPKLFSSNFGDIIIYLNSLEFLDDNKSKLRNFLKENCKLKVRQEDKLDPVGNQYEKEYSNIKDKKNIIEKVHSICPDFSKRKLNSWARRAVLARDELRNLTSEQRKAIVMAVFFSCSTYIDEEIDEITIETQEELIKCVNDLKKQSIEFIEDRRKDYNYGVENTKFIENIVFNLIDTCFLSFDSYLEE